MNKLYISIILILPFNFCFSAPVIKSIKDGYWNSASTWNLNRLPQVGDSIVIVAGQTVTVDNDINLNGASSLSIYGKLTFQNNNSTLSLSDGSFIWVFPGALIMGGGSASQKLRLDGKGIFKGNDDPVYGPMMASVLTNGFTPMSITTPITLPVKFVSFTVSGKTNSALLQWSVSGEINASRYEVERSFDGNNWTAIAYVAAVGNSGTNNYSYTDKTLSSKVIYYRIKEVDVDGNTTLTSIRSVQTDMTSSHFEVMIGAVSKKLVLQFPQQVYGNVVIRIITTSGQIVDQQTINNPVGQVVLNSKVSGIYIISISNGSGINTAKKVLL